MRGYEKGAAFSSVTSASASCILKVAARPSTLVVFKFNAQAPEERARPACVISALRRDTTEGCRWRDMHALIVCVLMLRSASSLQRGVDEDTTGVEAGVEMELDNVSS